MKQFIASLFPDKATAWKLAAMALLLLLMLVPIINIVAPFARAVFSPGDTLEDPGTVQEDTAMMTHYKSQEALLQEETLSDLQNQIAEAEILIGQYEEHIASLETTIADLTAQGQASEEIIAQLNEQLTPLQSEIARLTEERDAAVLELQAIKENLSMDHTIVVKITRDDWLPGVDVLSFNLHVTAEEYAMYQVGDTIQPMEGLDFPVSKEWTAVVSSMYINYLDI